MAVVGETVTDLMPPVPGRDDLVALTDLLLRAVRPCTSPSGALVVPPGGPGGYGARVDGLEGFARTGLLAGFRLAGAAGADPAHLAARYAEGLAAGTDPGHPERWPRLPEHGQAKVEAASVALVLDLTRPWIWDRLAPRVQEQVVDWLAPAVGDPTYPQINWVWFRLVVQTFLRSVDGPHDLDEMAADLRTHDGFACADGWLRDGPDRAFDHYGGWALHLYPALWARMRGAADLAAARRATDVERLDRFLLDAVHLVGADGSPLLQGRSLVYRFAAAAPFWAGALSEVPSVGPGLLRRAATSVVGHFLTHGVPDSRGLLTLGWHRAWPRLAQSYSGPASPYWAAKGLLGVALPPEHPVWSAPDEPLPVHRGDTLRALPAPGWLVHGTTADGVVRVVNHGTDHAAAGRAGADTPLYARLGYSTATAPLGDVQARTDPLEQAVVLADATGRTSHRTGMRLLTVRVDDPGEGHAGPAVAVAASTGPVHRLEPDAAALLPGASDHGGGLVGTLTPVGHLTVLSCVRGPWEVRVVRVDTAGPDQTLVLGGWPLTGLDVRGTTGPARAQVVAGRLRSSVHLLAPGPAHGHPRTHGTVHPRHDASPLGATALVPAVHLPAAPGTWAAVLVHLGTGTSPGDASVTTAVVDGPPHLRVRWPDGLSTTHLAPDGPW